MDEYNMAGYLLNKYSQLTPWVQALIGISFAGMVLGMAYFFKESIAAIMKPFCKQQDEGQKEEKKEWRDKYYRGDEEKVLSTSPVAFISKYGTLEVSSVGTRDVSSVMRTVEM